MQRCPIQDAKIFVKYFYGHRSCKAVNLETFVLFLIYHSMLPSTTVECEGRRADDYKLWSALLRKVYRSPGAPYGMHVGMSNLSIFRRVNITAELFPLKMQFSLLSDFN